MPKKIDITGKRFNRWLVKSPSEKRANGLVMWLCYCECGTERLVRSSDLTTGHSQSCGCLSKEALSLQRLKHGHSKDGKSKTYKAWKNMLQRCRYEKDKYYEIYGGRGIKVCDRWKEFVNFLEDMGERPEGKTIDRIDGDGNYEPSNCKWSTLKEQNNNRSNNVYLEYNGKRQTIAQWSTELGIRYCTLYGRIHRKWSTERALTT